MEALQAKRDYWHGQVCAWRESGQSQAAYCAHHGIKPRNLAYWIKRERTQSGTLTLIPVNLPQSRCTGDPILRGSRGWQLHIPVGVSPEWLADLMQRMS